MVVRIGRDHHGAVLISRSQRSMFGTFECEIGQAVVDEVNLLSVEPQPATLMCQRAGIPDNRFKPCFSKTLRARTNSGYRYCSSG
jgi:hypothetical protein